MKRIHQAAVLAALLLSMALPTPAASAAGPEPNEPEVVVYGGTPAGIAAALAAGQSGRRVLLIEPRRWIGGLTTNGLSHTDFRTFEGLTGTFLKFSQRVEAYYRDKYGPDSPQVKDSFRGTHAEPHVNLRLFEKMLAEQPTVSLRRQLRLVGVAREKDGAKRITSATFADPEGKTQTIRAAMWIDATYEGDLMAAAGVEYRVGREARKEHGESLAPEKADRQVQGYNFRLILTRTPEDRVMPAKPPGYRREEFLPLLELLKTGKVKRIFGYPSGSIYKAHEPRLPNGLYDINDMSRGAVRLSLPDINDDWPDGDAATRQRIFDEHLRHNVGILYFLQNDPAVPERVRKEAHEWGLSKSQFVENGHLPEQLYVRQARHMVGQHVFTERDTDYAPNDARGILRRDAIAQGDYGLNCHGTAHEGPRLAGTHTGEFYKGVAPYQIPYGVLVPRDCPNLLVPVAASSSHVGFCALRYEPIWTSLGQAAGFAVHVALDEAVPVQKVPVVRVQQLLHKDGAATIYTSDVPPKSPAFAAVQWWALQGGLHGLSPRPEKPGQRGTHITSQYYQAFPGHAVELERPLDAPLRKRWEEIARSLKLPLEPLAEETTRGGFIRRAWALSRSRE